MNTSHLTDPMIMAIQGERSSQMHKIFENGVVESRSYNSLWRSPVIPASNGIVFGSQG